MKGRVYMILKLRRLLAIAIDYYIIFHIIYLPLNYIFKNSTNILVDIFSGLLAIILLIKVPISELSELYVSEIKTCI